MTRFILVPLLQIQIWPLNEPLCIAVRIARHTHTHTHTQIQRHRAGININNVAPLTGVVPLTTGAVGHIVVQGLFT